MMNLVKGFIADEFGINGHRICPGRRRHRACRFNEPDRGWRPCLKPVRRSRRQPQRSSPRMIKIGAAKWGRRLHKRTWFRANGKPLSQEALNRP